jgi:hypothetical protein
MITRDQALAHSSPYVGFLVAELVVGTAIIVGWNVWERRDQILRLVRR